MRGQDLIAKQHLNHPIPEGGGEAGFAFSMVGEDDPTFRKVAAEPALKEPLLEDEDEILKNFKRDLMNEDINNKFKTDFAGDTFSQISSTFEPVAFGGQNPPVILNRPNSSQAHNRSENQDHQPA